MATEIIGSTLDPEKPPTTNVFKRQFVACLNCRSKKTKCHMQEELRRCTRCIRQNLDCVIPPRKQYVWKQKVDEQKNKVNKPLLAKSDNSKIMDGAPVVNLTEKSLNLGRSHDITTNAILGNNFSNIRTADRSIVDDAKYPERIDKSNDKKETQTSNPLEPQITTTHGALEFLTNAANNSENLKKKNSRIDQSKITDRKMEPFGYWELDMSIQDNQLQPDFDSNKNETLNFIYEKIVVNLPVLKDLLTGEEIETLVELFFLTQHPFYPFIPTHLKSLSQLYRFPLLLLTVLTISTRYQNGSHSNYEDIHITLWNHCQQMLSKTIWASVDSFGSLGTIFAFLLFTEWNPRSIHSKVSDYATISSVNSTSKEFESLQRSENLSFMLSGSAIRLANSLNIATKTGNLLLALQITELNVTMNFNLNNNLNILKIDNRNVNQFNKEYKNELEIAKKYVLNGNKQTLDRWNIFTKGLQSENTISDSLLINFWQDEKLLYYKHKAVYPSSAAGHSSRSYTSSNSNSNKRYLFLNRWQRAEIKMLEMIKLSYETLYYSSITNNYEEPFYSNPTSFNSISTHSLNMNDCINFLKFLQIIINNWYEQFEDLLKPIDPIKDKLIVNEKNLKDPEYVLNQTELRRGEWFIIDFHYCKIYGFSIILEFFHKKKNIILHHSNMQLIDYLKDCYISCQYIHDSCLRLMKADLLPYLPIRLIGKVIRSIAFLVKMYIYLQQFKKFKILESKKLLLNLRFVKIEDILLILRNLSKCLKKTAPDSSHLGLHYSKILKFLCEKISKKENVDLPEDEEDDIDEIELDDNADANIQDNGAHCSKQRGAGKPPEFPSAKDDMFDILFNYKDHGSYRYLNGLFEDENNAIDSSLFSPQSTGVHLMNQSNSRVDANAGNGYSVIDEILGLTHDSETSSLTRPNSVILSDMSPAEAFVKQSDQKIDRHILPSEGGGSNIISSVSIFDVFGDII
ncbi:hypothetical protein QEN19_001626 [Hanseniaspora menglaensis]